MSRLQVAEFQYRNLRERDAREGAPDTPERRAFLRSLAEDFADEMQHDAEMDAQGHDDEVEVEAGEDDQ